MAILGMNYRDTARLGSNFVSNKKKSDQILLAGPWVGEFGWELFCWQGYIRKIAPEFKKVIVLSRSGHDFLYNDFCDEFIPFNPPQGSSSDSWMCRGLNNIQVDNFVRRFNFDIREKATNIGFLLGNDGVPQMSNKFINQKFIKYKSDSLDKKYDLIIHPRNKNVGDKRNWNKDNWQQLVNKLSDKYTIAEIGSHEAFKLDGVDDYRMISIRDTVSLMNRTKLVIGQSSGPLHLASLSGAPHFVWSTPHNRARYLNVWNPFKTPAYFYDKEGWNPKVDNIYNEISKILE